jgi:hypothetical protein
MHAYIHAYIGHTSSSSSPEDSVRGSCAGAFEVVELVWAFCPVPRETKGESERAKRVGRGESQRE